MDDGQADRTQITLLNPCKLWSFQTEDNGFLFVLLQGKKYDFHEGLVVDNVGFEIITLNNVMLKTSYRTYTHIYLNV